MIEDGLDERLADPNPLGFLAAARWDIPDVRVLPAEGGDQRKHARSRHGISAQDHSARIVKKSARFSTSCLASSRGIGVKTAIRQEVGEQLIAHSLRSSLHVLTFATEWWAHCAGGERHRASASDEGSAKSASHRLAR